MSSRAPLDLRTPFTNRKAISGTLTYLEQTKVGTRRCILGQAEEDESLSKSGWGDLNRAEFLSEPRREKERAGDPEKMGDQTGVKIWTSTHTKITLKKILYGTQNLPSVSSSRRPRHKLSLHASNEEFKKKKKTTAGTCCQSCSTKFLGFVFRKRTRYRNFSLLIKDGTIFWEATLYVCIAAYI